MFEIYFYILTIIAIVAIAYGFEEASVMSLRSGAVLLIFISLLITTQGIERPDRFVIDQNFTVATGTLTVIDTNNTLVTGTTPSLLPATPKEGEDMGLYIINQIYFFGGIFVLLFTFGAPLIKRYRERLIKKGF